jgi:putative ABC transport system permease protein
MELRQDVSYAFRMLRRSPGFTAVAVLALALGLGANSAIFSVVQGVLLESLPYRDAERLWRVRTLYPDGTAYTALSAPDFMSVRAENTVFEQVEAYANRVSVLLGAGDPREIRRTNVSDGLFGLLGFQISTGRGFLPEENQRGRGNVAVLDHGFWRREFSGDASVLGRKVSLSGVSYTIVGVLAPGARLPFETDVYVPLEYDNAFSATAATGRRSEFLGVLARARPDVAGARIDADLGRLGARLQTAFPQSNQGLTFNAIGLRELILGDVRKPLLVLLGAVGFVLLVACANVANLLLARASARRQEISIRVALGAGRGRLVRQFLTEAVVLGLCGGAVGLTIALWGTRALVAARPADIPRLEQVGLNTTVVLFTLGITLATSILFGLLPAFQASRNLSAGLREAGRSGGAGGHRVRAALVVAEMALAVVLLTGAGLLIRSFVELVRVDPGFRSEQALALRLSLQGENYSRDEQLRNRVLELEERLRALPGVAAVGGTTVLPLSGLGPLVDFRVEGAPPPPPNVNQEIAFASVTPDYFRTVGAPIELGRGLTSRDHADAPAVAVINRAAVHRWFPGIDPIGRRVNISGRSIEVVGVVRDLLQGDPGRQAAPQLFAPYVQRPSRTIRIVVRAAGDPLALASGIRGEIRRLDPNLPLPELTPLERLVTASVARPRFYTALLALFAGVALALSATGIFGVMSYAVAQRAREISIRMALGARPGGVLRRIVGGAVALAALGLVAGLATALALGQVIAGLLYGVRLLDPVTFGVVALVLLGSAAAASFVPARRATRLDPAALLRE